MKPSALEWIWKEYVAGLVEGSAKFERGDAVERRRFSCSVV